MLSRNKNEITHLRKRRNDIEFVGASHCLGKEFHIDSQRFNQVTLFCRSSQHARDRKLKLAL